MNHPWFRRASALQGAVRQIGISILSACLPGMAHYIHNQGAAGVHSNSTEYILVKYGVRSTPVWYWYQAGAMNPVC